MSTSTHICYQYQTGIVASRNSTLVTRTALATHCLGFLFLLCAVWLLTAAAIGRVLPRGSVASHAPALTSHSDDSLSALLASTTHCRSFSLCFAQLQPSFLSLTHGPTDDRLRKVVKHSATCCYTLMCFHSQMTIVSPHSLSSMAISCFLEFVLRRLCLGLLRFCRCILRLTGQSQHLPQY